MIDAHLHLQDCISPSQGDEVMATLRKIGVATLFVNGTSPEDWEAVSELAEQVDEVIPSFGVHPWKEKDLTSGWEDVLLRYLTKHAEAGVGEIGLDKWISGHDLPRQKEIFLEQLALADSLGRSVSIHCLQAWGSLRDCMEQSPYAGPFLLHSYGGPKEMVDEWVARGAYFSLSGYFFRPEKTAKLEVFASVPEDRILLETDAPDMALSDHDVRYQAVGMKNHPANLEVIYERYADWTSRSFAEVRGLMERNFLRFRTFSGPTPEKG